MKQRAHDKLYGKEEPVKKINWLKRTRPKRFADKRVVENEIYQKRRNTYLAKHKFCECGCGREATQVHHKRGRRGKYKGVSLLIVVKFFMAVSDYCHIKIHRNVDKWATKKGYLLQRNTKTEKQPIMKKVTAAIAIIFLISLFTLSFAQNTGNKTDAKKNVKVDTAYYISNTLEWFQLLYKAVALPDSVDKFQKTAILSWITTARPILPDTTKRKSQ